MSLWSCNTEQLRQTQGVAKTSECRLPGPTTREMSTRVTAKPLEAVLLGGIRRCVSMQPPETTTPELYMWQLVFLGVDLPGVVMLHNSGKPPDLTLHTWGAALCRSGLFPGCFREFAGHTPTNN